MSELNGNKIDGAIWMLHRVAPDRKESVFHRVDRDTRITPEFLEACILDAKEQGYRFVSLDEFLNNKHEGIGTDKDIVVTIDDGYRDIYEYAKPIFEKYQVPYVFYVASDFIQYGFDRCVRPEIDGTQQAMDIIYQNQNITINGKCYPSRNEAEKAQCFDALWKRFKRVKMFYPWKSGRKLLTQLLKGYVFDFDKYFQKYVCSPHELREMADTPLCTIGSHAQSHTPLYKIWWYPKLKREIIQSKRDLEAMIGKPVEHFSYPYGSYCAEVDALVRKHYRSAAAVGSIRGEADVYCAGDDDYILPRVHVKQGKNPLRQVQFPHNLKDKVI